MEFHLTANAAESAQTPGAGPLSPWRQARFLCRTIRYCGGMVKTTGTTRQVRWSSEGGPAESSQATVNPGGGAGCANGINFL